MKEKHQILKINQLNLHVVSVGDETGPLVILLHGFPEAWFGWRKQIEYLASQGFWVLAPDQRGYNLSEKPPTVQAYQMENLTQDVDELLKWSGRKKAVLIGHDWGGMVAWNFAMKYPDALDRLIILNAPHPSVMKKNLKSNWKQLLRSWYIFAFQLPRLPEWYLSKKQALALTRMLKGSSRPEAFSEEELKEYQEAWLKPGGVTSMLHWYRASRVPRRLTSTQSNLGEPKRKSVIEVPTLIIWGAQDQVFVGEMPEQSLKYCKNGRLEIFPEATHWVHHEEGTKVNKLIHSFIQNNA